MAARWTAWLVWAALAASLVFWVLRLSVQPGPLPARVQTVASEQSTRGEILRLFANPVAASAAPAMQATAASRMRLLGVVAGADDDTRGWVVLSLDGQPARTIKVGARVDGDWVVQTVTRQRVEIGPAGAPAVAVLELPLPAPAATGQLPGVAGMPPGAAAVLAPAVPPLPESVPPVMAERSGVDDAPAAGGRTPGEAAR
jgi:general secretion pathway protein C